MATLAAVLALTACSAPPAPREARLDGGFLARPTAVEGVVGAELTLEEIRRGFVEPRCARAGLVMASLRVSRRPDGAQDVEARCAMGLVAPRGRPGA